MRRWVVTVVVALALVGGGLAWASQRGSAPATRYLTASVARGTVAQTVSATGAVQPSGTLALAFGGSTAVGGSGGAGSSGSSSSAARTVSSGATTVTTVTAKTGERVSAGTTLATLDATAARAQLASAESQLTSAQARQAAEPTGTSQATLDADAASVAQAEQQVQVAQAAVAATVLKAPVDGIVTAVAVTPGLPPVSPAVTMQTGNLAVLASVSEDDVTSLRAGQKATITFPALSSSTSGTVGTLPTAASGSGAGGSAVTFPVVVDLPHPPAHLLPGMTAQITIVIAERENVVYVPTAALQGSSTAANVQVLDQGAPVSKPVEIGLSTSSTTEVVAGLTPGQTVVTGVINPSSGATSSGGGPGGGGLGGGGGFRGGGQRGGFGGGGFRGGGNG